MLTGIIQEIGKLQNIEISNNKRYLTISCQTIQHDLVIGESVACNGICLTVIKHTPTDIKVEVMNQTIQTTTANIWKTNCPVHLEKALTLSGRLNGHIVQGHIDTMTALNRAFRENNTLYLEFSLPREYQHLLVVEHGSICIDGVSLTIARLTDMSFQVALIEHTLSMTHFNDLRVGDMVNIEFDIVGKYIHKLVNKTTNKKSNITEEWLLQNGF